MLTLILALATSCSTYKEIKNLEKDAYAIAYTPLNNFYVRNDLNLTKQQNLTINSREQFESYFGYAAVMGTNGQPTDINWNKQYVLAVIMPETTRSTYMEPVSVLQSGNNIIFNYSVKKGQNNSYSLIPFVGVVLDRPTEAQQVQFYFNQK